MPFYSYNNRPFALQNGQLVPLPSYDVARQQFGNQEIGLSNEDWARLQSSAGPSGPAGPSFSMASSPLTPYNPLVPGTGGSGVIQTPLPPGANTPPAAPATDFFQAPQFSGPYAAPLTAGQLDVLSGFNRLFSGNPLLQTEDIRKGIEFALSGGPVYGPGAGKTLTQQIEPFRLPSEALETARGVAGGGIDNILGSINNYLGTNTTRAAGAPNSFDSTELFKTADTVFQSDLDKIMADTRAEYSGLGLGPGSSDRAMGLVKAGGDATARHRLGKLDMGRQIFEDTENRGLAGAEIANRVLGNRANMLPLLAGLEELPFERYRALGEPAADRAMAAVPQLLNIEQRPFDRFVQQYGINEAARGAADQEVVRRIAEFGRTQGMEFDQVIKLINSVAPQVLGVGPSTGSQIASAGAGWVEALAKAIPVVLQAK